MQDWVQFDEPVKRVVSMAIDVVVADMLADVAVDGAHAAGSASAMRMFMEAELSGARVRHGDAAVNEAMASTEPLMTAISAGVALNEAVNNAIVAAGEAACSVLDGENAATWHGLADAQRRVVCCGLAMERNRRALQNAKSEITGVAQRMLGAGMVSVIEGMAHGEGDGATARGFNVGYNASVIVDQAIVEAFDSALALLMSARGAQENAA
jgi:hypothetical protein